MKVQAIEDVCFLENGNKILGTFPSMIDSEIVFNGKNNVLFCESGKFGVKLIKSCLKFNADNSVIFLSQNKHNYEQLNVSVYNDNVFYMGKNNYINEKMTVILSEQRHCLIGDECLFSCDVTIRNADSHLIYNCDTMNRINPTKSVYIGDHVWISQNCMILKGSEIDSGSIIGACSVVTNKKIPSNTIWAGNPAREISRNVFWDEECVHAYKEDRTNLSEQYEELISSRHNDEKANQWIYCETNNAFSIDYSKIDSDLNNLFGSENKFKYLFELSKNNSKNRFVHQLI